VNLLLELVNRNPASLHYAVIILDDATFIRRVHAGAPFSCCVVLDQVIGSKTGLQEESEAECKEDGEQCHNEFDLFHGYPPTAELSVKCREVELDADKWRARAKILRSSNAIDAEASINDNEGWGFGSLALCSAYYPKSIKYYWLILLFIG
jgi:hypothetical protein